MHVYLDNSATTACSPDSAEMVTKVSTADYGNPSSLHLKGLEAERYVKDAASEIAKTLHCRDREIVFTSGGTESNNLAILGGAMANRRRGRHLITTQIEHPSVANAMKFLEEQDFEITRLPVNAYGEISTEDLADALRDDTILVSVMMVNNEIGALEPVSEAGRIIHEKNPEILFHADAVQAYGKFRIQPKKMNIDLLSASGHKIHGPKGVGFLYVRDKAKIHPISFGGGQQHGMRSGTLNAPGIAGLCVAAWEAYEDFEKKIDDMYALRRYFIERLSELEDVKINGRFGNEAGPYGESAGEDVSSGGGSAKDFAPHIVSAVFSGVKSEVLLHALEERGIYASAGSACAQGRPSESVTLPAIGLSKAQQESTLRFSFSTYTTRKELDYTADTLAGLLPTLRKYTRR